MYVHVVWKGSRTNCNTPNVFVYTGHSRSTPCTHIGHARETYTFPIIVYVSYQPNNKQRYVRRIF